jgi:hypothetical protein
MELLKGVGGMKLSDLELQVWVRANTSSESLDRDDLAAIAREHSLEIEDSESFRIPASEFKRAHQVLGQLVCFYEGLSEWGEVNIDQSRIGFDSFSAPQELELKLDTAIQLYEAIGAESYPMPHQI